MLKIFRWFLTSIVAAAGFWLGLYVYLPLWASRNVTLTEPRLVVLAKGESLGSLAEEMHRIGLISSSWSFRLWMRNEGTYGKFQAGQYKFEGDVSPTAIRETMEAGKTFQPIALQFVIPEGFTLKQVIDRLEAKGLATRKELEALGRDKSLREKFGIAGPTLEGFLYPATYTFHEMPTAEDVFKRMLVKFFESLPRDLEDKLKNRNLTLYQAVTIASLIEKETQLDEERDLVSEVIWNRLRDGEPLGIDAALIYGIPNYQGDIKWEHLKDSKNLYNNRIHKGLPPTPIGAVSMASLEAVFSPSQEGYRYYVLASDGSKRHRFSKSLEEHNFYVKQLLESFR